MIKLTEQLSTIRRWLNATIMFILWLQTSDGSLPSTDKIKKRSTIPNNVKYSPDTTVQSSTILMTNFRLWHTMNTHTIIIRTVPTTRSLFCLLLRLLSLLDLVLEMKWVNKRLCSLCFVYSIIILRKDCNAINNLTSSLIIGGNIT